MAVEITKWLGAKFIWFSGFFVTESIPQNTQNRSLKHPVFVPQLMSSFDEILCELKLK